MSAEIIIKVNREDLNQLLECLEERAESWERMGEELRGSGPKPPGAGRGDEPKVTELGDLIHGYERALAFHTIDQMAARYRDILDSILAQAEEQGVDC